MLSDPDMGKMAAKDIEQLDANMVNLVNQIKGNVVTIHFLYLNPLKRRPYISGVFFLYGVVLERGGLDVPHFKTSTVTYPKNELQQWDLVWKLLFEILDHLIFYYQKIPYFWI